VQRAPQKGRGYGVGHRVADRRGRHDRVRRRRLRQTGTPPHTIGYIYVPALLAIVAASVVMAPIGARAAHRWPPKRLKRGFALLLYGLSAYMLWKGVTT